MKCTSLPLQRREFITLLGGAAAAWPLAARAQQAERMRRIGVLGGFAEDDPEMKARLAGFRQGLEQAWMVGRPQCPHRLPLRARRHRAGAGACERAGCSATRRDSCAFDAVLRRVAAREPDDPDRVR